MSGVTPGLPRRLASMAYEAVLLFAVAFFAAWVFFFASGGRDATSGALRHELQLFILVVFAGYFLWCWLRGGQTLAMKAWHIRLVGNDFLQFKANLAKAEGAKYANTHAFLLYEQGKRFSVSPRIALTRLLLAFLFVPTGISILWALCDRERQFLHDRLSGTRLVNA